METAISDCGGACNGDGDDGDGDGVGSGRSLAMHSGSQLSLAVPSRSV